MSIQYYQEKMYGRNLLWHREDISCSGCLLLFCTIYKQYLHVKVHCARKGHSKLNYTSNEKQNVRSDQSSSSSLPRTTWRIGMNMYILQEKIWNGKDGGTRKLNTFYQTCWSENIKLLKCKLLFREPIKTLTCVRVIRYPNHKTLTKVGFIKTWKQPLFWLQLMEQETVIEGDRIYHTMRWYKKHFPRNWFLQVVSIKRCDISSRGTKVSCSSVDLRTSRRRQNRNRSSRQEKPSSSRIDADGVLSRRETNDN